LFISFVGEYKGVGLSVFDSSIESAPHDTDGEEKENEEER